MQAIQEYQQKLNDLVSNEHADKRPPLESQPTFDKNCMKEGYLQKKGQRLKGWKRRWFVCDGHNLAYYASRRDKKPNEVIALAGCAVQDGGRSETWNSPRIYLTDGATGVMYCLSAEDAKEVKEWLQVLQNAVSKLKKTEQPVKRPSAKGSPTKRASAVISAVKPSPSKEMSSPSHRRQTSPSIENDLSSGLSQLEGLLKEKKANFRPVDAKDGVIQSIGLDERSGRIVGKARTVLPISSDVAAYLLTDHHKRSEWDTQFPVSSHVAAFDDSTSLVHLSSGEIRSMPPVMSPAMAAMGSTIAGAVVPNLPILSSLLSVVGLTSDSTLTNMIATGVFGSLANQLDYSSWTKPRDLLLLRHVKEETSSLQGETGEEILAAMKENDDSEVSVVLILEKSVASDLKPVADDVIRAHVGLSGWLLEPVDHGDSTLATFVTDVDLGGWLPTSSQRAFLEQRLHNVAVLREYVKQSRLAGADLGLDEDEGVSENLVAMSGEQGVFHPKEYARGMVRMPTGGLKLVDKEVAKKQSGVLKDVMKSAGAKMLEGKSAVSLSLPVRIFEPRTNLERVVDLFLYAPTFLHKAAEATDPVERFKYVMAFAVAGLHHGVGQLKPFNPILGETLQTSLDDGTQVACEHTSHHPPISHFCLRNDEFRVSGHVLWHASFSVKSNALMQTNRGPVRVAFQDSLVTYNLPYLQFGGFLWGERTVDIGGSIHFEDKKNGLTCELKFNPDEKKGMGGMFAQAKTPSDAFRGVILENGTKEVAEVSGSWLDELRCGEKAYWTMNKEPSGQIVPWEDKNLLPSDSRYREDLRYLEKNELDVAQEWKVKLEVLQRADRKLRQDGRRPNHWSFKEESKGH